MQRPGLWTLCGIVLAGAGLATAVIAVAMSGGRPVWDPAVPNLRAIAAISASVALAGLLIALLNYALYRKRRQLERGEGLIARWQVTATELAAFHHLDTARGTLGPSFRNRAQFAGEGSSGTSEIRIGPTAIIAGGSSHWLGVGFMNLRGRLVDIVWLEGAPAMIEFVKQVADDHTSWIEVLRIPVPAEARAEGQRVLDHFARAIDPAARQRSRGTFAEHFDMAGAGAR